MAKSACIQRAHERLDMLKTRLCNLAPADIEKLTVAKSTHDDYIAGTICFFKKYIVDELIAADLVSSLRNINGGAVIKSLSNFLATNEQYGQGKTTNRWIKDRRSLAYFYTFLGFEEIGGDLTKIQNPSEVSSRPKLPQKKNRRQSISYDEFTEIKRERENAGDWDSVNYLILCGQLGIRPCEATNIKVLQEDPENDRMLIKIHTAKKTKKGVKDKNVQRGIDRSLVCHYDVELLSAIHYWESEHGDKAAMKRRQKNSTQRLTRAAKRLWPSSKKNFGHYTLRYNFASTAKYQCSDSDDAALMVAAMLGQKNTKSASSYGNANTGKSLRSHAVVICPTDDTLAKVVDNRTWDSKLDEKKDLQARRLCAQVRADGRRYAAAHPGEAMPKKPKAKPTQRGPSNRGGGPK